MRIAKRLLLVGSIILAVAVAALVGTWYYIGRPGSTPVEAWIGREITAVLKSYITPEVEFTDLDYRRPRTVVLKNLRLSSERRQFLSVDQAVLELAEIPREGQPIRIQRIDLTSPHIAIDVRPNGELVGWSHFVRPEVKRHPESVPPGRRLSDVLVLRHVQIRDGEVRYQAGADPEPMILPGIELALNTPPDATEPGWYRLVGTVRRDPILHADVDGRLNLDTGMLELAALKLVAALGEEQYGTLPPRLQQFLRSHEAHGQIVSTFEGRVPLRDPARAQGTVTAQLKDVRLKINAALAEVGSGTLRAGLPDAPVEIQIEHGSFTNAGRTLIATERLVAELPRIPRGLPMEVTRVQADRPQAELIHDPAGGFAGWNRLGHADQTYAGPPSTAPAPARTAGPANPYVRVREGEVRNGRVVYGLPDGGPPVILQNININLQGPPAGNPSQSSNGPAWQPVTASGQGEGLFHTALAGRFDLAGLKLDLDRFSFQSSVRSEAQYALLPEPVGTLFRRHGMTGDLAFTFRGQVPLAHMDRSVGQARMELRRTRLHFAGVEMPAERALFDFKIPAGAVKADVSALALVGDNVPMLEIQRLRFDLPKPPQKGGPLEIQTARFDRPRLRFIQAPEPDIGLLGWRRLVHPNTPFPRLSDFVRFRQMDIVQGEVLYDDNDGKGEPMVLTGMDMQFRTPPLQGAPGWYRLMASIRRKGLFHIDLDGRIDPDGYLLEFSRLAFDGELGPGQYGAFPPGLQSVLRRHEIRGRLSLTAQGRVPLNHLRDTRADIRAVLTHAHMALGQTVWPIDRVAFDATLQRRWLFSRYDANLFGGRVDGAVRLALDRPQPLSVTWNAISTHMEDTLRVVSPGPPKYSGILDTQGSFSINLHGGLSTLKGAGSIEVTDAKLVRLAVIRTLIAAVSTATLGLMPTHPDSASARFQLWPDHVQIDQATVNSDPVNLRLSGRINYDDTVDLEATAHVAGNIGRGIGTGIGQVGEIGTLGLLGRFSNQVGEAIGGAADALAIDERIVTYHVTGPMSNPQVGLNGLARR